MYISIKNFKNLNIAYDKNLFVLLIKLIKFVTSDAK
jgi:hypothetical protein